MIFVQFAHCCTAFPRQKCWVMVTAADFNVFKHPWKLYEQIDKVKK